MTEQNTSSLTTKIVKGTYEELSGKASDIVRQLSLAGIALIWLFKVGKDASPVLDTQLVRAALFIFCALSLDLLQYLVSTAMWHFFFRLKERNHTSPDEEFEAPIWMNWPTWTLFWLKAASMVIAYAFFILPFLVRKFGA
jgi:hypothetical protein